MGPNRKFCQCSTKHKHTTDSNDPNRKVHDYRSTVSDIVYRYLNAISDQDMRRRQRNIARNLFRRKHARRKDIERPRSFCLNTCLNNKFNCTKNSNSRRYSRVHKRLADTNWKKNVFYNALLLGLYCGYLTPDYRRGLNLRVSSSLGFHSTSCDS